jgi:hypothetical protein
MPLIYVRGYSSICRLYIARGVWYLEDPAYIAYVLERLY